MPTPQQQQGSPECVRHWVCSKCFSTGLVVVLLCKKIPTKVQAQSKFPTSLRQHRLWSWNGTPCNFESTPQCASQVPSLVSEQGIQTDVKISLGKGKCAHSKHPPSNTQDCYAER